jgi:bacillithiol biosynthesis deacetylase BshB1
MTKSTDLTPSAPRAALDCLVVAAHPDDAELFAGGTIALALRRGRRVGILDLTRGETASRGSAATRAAEAAAASRILGLTVRETLDLGDGDLANTQERRRAVAEVIRRLRPRLIIGHGPQDRHPDHRRAHELTRDAAFLAGVGGFDPIPTGLTNPTRPTAPSASSTPDAPAPWRVAALAFWPGNTLQPPPPADWVVDVSEVFEIKLAALRAYSTQFMAPGETQPGARNHGHGGPAGGGGLAEAVGVGDLGDVAGACDVAGAVDAGRVRDADGLPTVGGARDPNGVADEGGGTTYISSRAFWEHMVERSRDWGHRIGATHGEPFLLDRPAHAGHPLVRLVT